MNRAKFLRSLKRALRAYPRDSVQKTLDYYDEMISDRMEDGLSEAQAIAALGSIEDIVQSLPQTEGTEPKPASQRKRGWNTALLVLGFPLWLPLLIAFFAVLLAGVVVLLAAMPCLFVAVLALAAAVLWAGAAGLYQLFNLNWAQALCLFGGALSCAGLSCLLYTPVMRLERALGRLVLRILAWVRHIFTGKAVSSR